MKPLYIAGAIIAVLILGLVLWNFDPFHRRANAEAKAVTAEQGQALAVETNKVTERTFTKETVTHEKADAIVETIQAAPMASDPLPPDLLVSFQRGVASLRDDTAAPDDPSSAIPR